MPVSWMNRSFEEVLGNSPINLVAYSLKDPNRGHTQANKRYLARLVFTNTPRGLEPVPSNPPPPTPAPPPPSRIIETSGRGNDNRCRCSLLKCFSWCSRG